MKTPQPTILGLKKSFGYGDRLGLAGEGHIATAKKFGYAAIFSQQSIRELDRTERTAEEVMNAARDAVLATGYDQPWGADADHLKTRADVKRMYDAGFCFYTIDPSTYVVNEADTMSEQELAAEVEKQNAEGIYGDEEVENLYEGKQIEISDSQSLTFDRESLLRACVKYGRAIADVEAMAGHIAEFSASRPYEIEVSVDETDSPTSPLEHLFFALELKRRGVVVVSLAPRFIGDFEKGIDYKGDRVAFEESLVIHRDISNAFGPYKLSMHSGSDKFSVYPIFGRVCGEHLHVKTAGTSYLEALRVVCRVDPVLFRELTDYSIGRFSVDKATYHISTSDENVDNLGGESRGDTERIYLDENIGRQMLHVTFGSVLTKGKRENGQTYKEAILEILQNNRDLHRAVLESHFDKHLGLLCAG